MYIYIQTSKTYGISWFSCHLCFRLFCIFLLRTFQVVQKSHCHTWEQTRSCRSKPLPLTVFREVDEIMDAFDDLWILLAPTYRPLDLTCDKYEMKLIKLCLLCPNLEMKILAVACFIFLKRWNFVLGDSWRRGRVNFRKKVLHWWLRWVKYRNFIADLTPEWCESLEVYQWDKKQNMLGPRDLWDTSPR